MNSLLHTRYLSLVLVGALLGQPALAEIVVGQVVSVADGDTVTVLDAVKVQHKIRLSGIDAPERGMPFGQRSKEYLANMIFSRNVEVETDKVDRYRRRVGKIYSEGRDVNLAMVVAGLAWHYKKYEKEQSASDRLLYSQSEDEARKERIGLWADPAPVAPWEWRKTRSR